MLPKRNRHHSMAELESDYKRSGESARARPVRRELGGVFQPKVASPAASERFHEAPPFQAELFFTSGKEAGFVLFTQVQYFSGISSGDLYTIHLHGAFGSELYSVIHSG